MKKLLTCAWLIASGVLRAQNTDTTHPTATTQQAPAGLTVSGYVEVYYSHDFTAPKTTQERPAFLYNYKRSREVSLNLAFVKLGFTGERVRSSLALQAGTYAQYNYAAEQALVRNIFEASAGVKLSSTHDLWFDAGVFASHIGFESAVGKDNWTLTRSMVAENSPYYLAGAKLTYNTPNGKWTLLGSVVNGWQRIRRLSGYTGIAGSTQVQYRPSPALTLNWSSFLGSDRPDSLRQTRLYHNLYALWQPAGKVALTAGFDIGADRWPRGFCLWYTPTAIVRYAAAPHVRLAGRLEYFDDRHGIIISTGTPNGFRTWGYSLNGDYVLRSNALFRLEGKLYRSQDTVFEGRGRPSRSNLSLTTSVAVSF